MGQPLADCDFNRAALHPAYPIKRRTSAERTQASPERRHPEESPALDPLENNIRRFQPAGARKPRSAQTAGHSRRPVEQVKATRQCHSRSVPVPKECAPSGPAMAEASRPPKRCGLPLQILRRIDLERQHPLSGLTVRLPGRHAGEQFHRSFGERHDRV